MPIYLFPIYHAQGMQTGGYGLDLPDDEAALDCARDIKRELLRFDADFRGYWLESYVVMS